MLNAWEELSCGALLAQFRRRVNMPARQVAPRLTGAWNESRISEIEKNNTGRPTLSELNEFAELYNCTDFERSFLWRAADHVPSAADIEAIGRSCQPFLDAQPGSCYILDSHYHVLAWNARFADFCGPVAGMEGLPLEPGQSLLLLLWSQGNGCRAQLSVADWERLTHFALVRFWHVVRPLIQANWYRGTKGVPDWLLEQLRMMENLPPSDAQAFRHQSDDIRHRLDVNRLDPYVQLVQSDGRVDRLLFREGERRVELIPDLLADARFSLWQHVGL